MNPGIENNVDWTAASTPADEKAQPGLSGQRKKPQTAPVQKPSVMDQLLGKNDLAACEPGRDPYNTTGRFFRG
jgi:hypothetical protein